MVGNKLQTTVNAFRAFVHSQGWTIIAEKEIAYGYQLVVTDGTAKTPVDLFTTGKALVQGKPSELQIAIKAWVYQQQVSSSGWGTDLPAPTQRSADTRQHANTLTAAHSPQAISMDSRNITTLESG